MRDFLHKLIIPHPHNNFRAKVLHFKSFLVVISILILSSFFFSSGINPFAEKIQALADISTLELLNFTNEKRVENGLPPLDNNQELENAAQAKASHMLENDYWAHNSPDGVTPWVFIKESGYEYVYAGENLAKGFRDSQDVVNAWMASPSHRDNLLSENFKDVGYAVRTGTLDGENTFLVVQEFGNKTALPVEKAFEILPPVEVNSRVLAINFESIKPNQANSISYEFIVLLIIGFIVVLLIDLFVVERKNIVRFVGHNMDHVLFLVIVIIVVTLLGKGYVL